MTAEALWHDVECGAYEEDLSLWEELARAHGGPVLELGAGNGRVALHLARRGFDVEALDVEASLIATFLDRAQAEGLSVSARVADARNFRPDREFALVIGAMQLVQLLGGPGGRRFALECVRAALRPDGVAAFAIVEGVDAVGEAPPHTLPDVRETDGWIHSSRPLGVAAVNGNLRVRRLRQLVSPAGELTEFEHVDVLDLLDAAELEREGAAAGLEPLGTRETPPSDLHVGSSVVLFGGRVA
jgi:SAM-dependent methyltransferase